MRLVPEPDWAEVAELVRRSYRLVAPKKLAALWLELLLVLAGSATSNLCLRLFSCRQEVGRIAVLVEG